MTRTVCEGDFPAASDTLHGQTSLEEYIKEPVTAAA